MQLLEAHYPLEMEIGDEPDLFIKAKASENGAFWSKVIFEEKFKCVENRK